MISYFLSNQELAVLGNRKGPHTRFSFRNLAHHKINQIKHVSKYVLTLYPASCKEVSGMIVKTEGRCSFPRLIIPIPERSKQSERGQIASLVW